MTDANIIPFEGSDGMETDAYSYTILGPIGGVSGKGFCTRF